ncbi:hypothetical protein [Citrobacter sp. U14242]|uniref:hypothetical protein n=1 Tax=Citrobacter sp. U14242 TaxID=3390192 RepID=UPI00397BA982
MDDIALDTQLRHLAPGEEVLITFQGMSFRCCRYELWYFFMTKVPMPEIDLPAWLYNNSEALDSDEQMLSFRGEIYFCILQKKPNIAHIYSRAIKHIG